MLSCNRVRLLQAQLIFGLMGTMTRCQFQPVTTECEILWYYLANKIGLPQPQLG
ncbi:hypothetical protein D3C75_1134930 [compost metagenome]